MTHNVASIFFFFSAFTASLPGAPFVLYFKETGGGVGLRGKRVVHSRVE